MSPATPRLRILAVGGNAVSAFLSWRLQATNACDVTLVWKNNFEAVAQYGISMRSSNPRLGNERFKPRAVVKTPDEAPRSPKNPYDYVLLCIKALPDVFDIAAVIESVVTPQHTCILLNTTSSLGIESYLEERFPSNVLLSLVCGAEVVQVGASEFEHRGDSTDLWVGWAIRNPAIPAAIQKDMAEALAMTLKSGNVDCEVSENIRQQQFEQMIGPISFHPESVILDCPNHAELLNKVGVRAMINGVIDELIELATAYNCKFPMDYRERVIEQQIKPADKFSYMYQDFLAKRPMEVETYLGSPIRMSKDVGITLKRVETLYAILHHKNIENMKNPGSPAPAMQNPPPRSSSVAAGPGPRPMGGMPNGMANGRPPRGQSFNGPPGMMRRGPGPNGYGGGRMANGPGNASQYGSRRPSVDGNDLQEFSHLMLYDQAVPEGGFAEGSSGVYGEPNMGSSTSDLALRERELAIRERELQLERQRMQMMGRKGGRRGAPSRAGMYDDEDDEDGDYFDPMASGIPNAAVMDDNFDMLSVTSRRNRKTSANNPGRFGPPSRGGRGLYNNRRNRTSASLMSDIPGITDNIMDNALMGYSSNRYGSVDRQTMGQESRQNSLTQQRLNELQRGGSYGGYPPFQRRSSQPPGPIGPMSPGPMSAPMRPSPPNGMGYGPPGMPGPGGMPRRTSPPGASKMQRPPPGNDPYQVAAQAVSNPNLLKQSPQVRSLTGSASASLGDTSGASAHLDSEPSATSSQSSLGPRPQLGVRS